MFKLFLTSLYSLLIHTHKLLTELRIYEPQIAYYWAQDISVNK